jgi:hypothetical protein
MAGKTALENLGLAKGDDIKDKAMFANVVTTMVHCLDKGARHQDHQGSNGNRA